MEESKYWIALGMIPDLGARRIKSLVEHFGSAKSAFCAAPDELYSTGIPPKVLETFLKLREKADPQRNFQEIRNRGFGALTLADPGYPAMLKLIFDPPAVLFYRGNPGILNNPCVAVVGSRKASEYGRAVAEKMAAGLGALGITVVSGMARGIDTSAHLGALKAGGVTAAVLGCGPDICYPPENKPLREQIARQGVVISEFPPGTKPLPQHFPMRNRIISGLCLGTVVVEAAEKSGALITADCALEQNREVFAIPGNINSPGSKGCHRLLKEGAALAEGPADVLLALGFQCGQTAEEPSELLGAHKGVIGSLEDEPVHFDELLRKTGLDVPDLAAALLELEMAGLVRKLPGKYFLRV